MLPSGGIAFAEGGFVVYIRDLKRESPHRILLDNDAALPDLAPRERFTLAHELAHTFFFTTSSPPAKLAGYPRSRILEELCQYGARQLLLPEAALRRRLAENDPVTSAFICRIADQFAASPEVVIRRLDESGMVGYSGPSLLMLQEEAHSDDAEVIAAYIDSSLLPYRLRPEPYTSLSEWGAGMLDEGFWASSRWQGTSAIRDATLKFRKIPYGPGFCFLEIDVVLP
jgi:hypothetical protein